MPPFSQLLYVFANVVVISKYFCHYLKNIISIKNTIVPRLRP